MRRFLNWLLRRKRGVELRGVSKAEAYGYKHAAERRLGLKWRGKYILVRSEPGYVMSNDRPWLGQHGPWDGVATGYYRDDEIVYFTTRGDIRPATGIHEWGHAILHSHRVPVAEHHAVMRRHGIP